MFHQNNVRGGRRRHQSCSLAPPLSHLSFCSWDHWSPTWWAQTLSVQESILEEKGFIHNICLASFQWDWDLSWICWLTEKRETNIDFKMLNFQWGQRPCIFEDQIGFEQQRTAKAIYSFPSSSYMCIYLLTLFEMPMLCQRLHWKPGASMMIKTHQDCLCPCEGNIFVEKAGWSKQKTKCMNIWGYFRWWWVYEGKQQGCGRQ